MSNIDKQALRQIAESVDREEWDVLDNGDADYQVIVSGSLERGATYRSYQPVTNEISNKKIAAFIAAFNPKVALALLDELEAETGYREGAFIACNRWHDKFRETEDKLECAERRIAELEAREVTLPPTFWYEHDDLSRDVPVLDKRLVKKAIRAAGIKVKGE
ncbi:ead/Ea22-like family protein [Salmonella enterica]|nr:ead/Ea22-like family protein [Salmonella enterica]EAZ0443473.1 ead/Ea22-like family protein [Salmonella enterica]EAZ0478901.1 ead/Ea22-like family protein [Salmonella enterica]EBF4969841.1 ead/Ea22-like family protein [Salmonella enterica]EBQ5308068.1 ead/Ea22-like family protein [Salmonella enterica]